MYLYIHKGRDHKMYAVQGLKERGLKYDSLAYVIIYRWAL